MADQDSELDAILSELDNIITGSSNVKQVSQPKRTDSPKSTGTPAKVPPSTTPLRPKTTAPPPPQTTSSVASNAAVKPPPACAPTISTVESPPQLRVSRTKGPPGASQMTQPVEIQSSHVARMSTLIEQTLNVGALAPQSRPHSKHPSAETHISPQRTDSGRTTGISSNVAPQRADSPRTIEAPSNITPVRAESTRTTGISSNVSPQRAESTKTTGISSNVSPQRAESPRTIETPRNIPPQSAEQVRAEGISSIIHPQKLESDRSGRNTFGHRPVSTFSAASRIEVSSSQTSNGSYAPPRKPIPEGLFAEQRSGDRPPPPSPQLQRLKEQKSRPFSSIMSEAEMSNSAPCSPNVQRHPPRPNSPVLGRPTTNLIPIAPPRAGSLRGPSSRHGGQQGRAAYDEINTALKAILKSRTSGDGAELGMSRRDQEEEIEDKTPAVPPVTTEDEKQAFLRRKSEQLSSDTKLETVIMNVYNMDRSYRKLLIDAKTTAADVCDVMIEKNHVTPDPNWQLIEYRKNEGLERPIEDHERILSIYSTCPEDMGISFLFRQNRMKTHILENASPQDLYKAAETSGQLWIRKPGKRWREFYCFLRHCRLIYSKRKTSMEPKHTHTFAELASVTMYTCLEESDEKKLYDAPAPYLIVLKASNKYEAPKDTLCVCALNETDKYNWLQGIRLMKYGVTEVQRSYQMSREKYIERMSESRNPLEPSVPSADTDDSEFMKREMSRLFADSWFHSELPKESAEDCLLRDGPKQDGSFLVRTSEGRLIISLRHGQRILHVPISTVSVNGKKQFTMEESGRTYDRVSDIVRAYHSDPGSLPTRLSIPFERRFFQL